MPAPRFLLCALAIALPLPDAALAAPDSPSVQLRILARALVPGEPVRVVAECPEPLASVTGSFLGESLSFARDDAEPARWSAWSLIALDRKPGKGSLSVLGRTQGGADIRAGREVRIAAKKFPVQKLEVESKYVTPPPEVEARIVRERERLKEIYAARTPLGPVLRPFVRPVPGEATSVFGARRVYNGVPRDPHPGLDLRAATGTTVRASGPGRVVLAEDLYFSGGTVIVDHGGGLFTVYGHLSRIDVHAGDELHGGETVGESGATGRVTGPHLHWGAKIGDRPFDPTALLDPALFR